MRTFYIAVAWFRRRPGETRISKCGQETLGSSRIFLSISNSRWTWHSSKSCHSLPLEARFPRHPWVASRVLRAALSVIESYKCWKPKTRANPERGEQKAESRKQVEYLDMTDVPLKPQPDSPRTAVPLRDPVSGRPSPFPSTRHSRPPPRWPPRRRPRAPWRRPGRTARRW